MSDCPVCMGIEGYTIHMCGRVNQADAVATDNTAVIRALEKRVEELEYYNLGLANESCAQQARIRELEKVADAAAEWAWRGDSCPMEWRNKLEEALRAAGYLKD